MATAPHPIISETHAVAYSREIAGALSEKDLQAAAERHQSHLLPDAARRLTGEFAARLVLLRRRTP